MATDRVYKKTKVDLRSNDHNDEDPILLQKHKIFLSHSGAREMHFVEKLCEDLESHSRFPFCDKRPSSLSKSENFFNLIEDVMAQIDMMVVVVSEEYFTSKWPMIELHGFMEASAKDPKLKILPLFWGLNVHEFCDPHRQERWFEVWEKMAIVDVQIKVEEWKQSLNLIYPSLYGMVYNQDSKYGEVAYRDEIVSNICNTIPSYINLSDDLNLQNRLHLCQVVLQQFDNIPDLAKIQGVRVMGLYGQDNNEGLGKAQICKIMCYEMDSEFEGKACHVELGKQSEHELLKKVLTALTNTSMLEVVQEMGKEECRNVLFNEKTWKGKTFLVIDNVRDDQVDSLEQASMLLRAPFVKGSRMIVTSRFKQTLTSLNIDEIACLHVSKLERELLSFDVKKRMLDRGKRKLDMQMSPHWTKRELHTLWEKPTLNMEKKMYSEDSAISQYFANRFCLERDFDWQRFDNLSELRQPQQRTARIQQPPPSIQTRWKWFDHFKQEVNSLSLQIQTENVEPLSEGRTSDVTMSVEELQSIPQAVIQPMDTKHDPSSSNESSKESSSQLLSPFWEELHKLTRSLSMKKVPTPSKQTANLTLDQFLDNNSLHNPDAMLIAGRVQVSNRPSVQFVFKDDDELAKVVGVGCCGQNAVVNITKSLKVQVVHDEDAWHQIWNEARTGGSSSQLMTLKNPRSHLTVDDVTTLGNLSSQRLAKQFGVGLECDSHLQSSVKIRHQEKGRREFLILMFARYLLLDEILETKCHDNYVEASAKNIPFCEESNALRKSANLHHGESNAGEWTWTSTLWANLWNYLPSLVQNVGNTQLGTGRGGIGDGGRGGDGSDGGGDRDDSSGGDGVLPLPPQDLDLEKDGFAVVEVYPGYGGQWGNKDLVDKDLQDSTITPTLTFHFEKSKQRRELNVVLCVRFDLGEVVGPKPRDEEELRFGWFHDNLRISLQSQDDDAAFLKPADHQVVDAPDISTTTSSTSSSITSNPFHVSLEAPGCSRSSPGSLFAMMGTLGISKDLKSRNTRVMELTSQLINKQVLGGFHYQDRSTENKNSKLAFRYVFPSIPKDRVVHDDTTRNIYMLSGLCATVSPTVRGTWHRLNMSEASPYTFHSSRRFNEILASRKRILLKDCKSFQQTYDLKLHINHAMTHIYEYVGRPQRLKGGESCELLEVGSVQDGP